MTKADVDDTVGGRPIAGQRPCQSPDTRVDLSKDFFDRSTIPGPGAVYGVVVDGGGRHKADDSRETNRPGTASVPGLLTFVH